LKWFDKSNITNIHKGFLQSQLYSEKKTTFTKPTRARK